MIQQELGLKLTYEPANTSPLASSTNSGNLLLGNGSYTTNSGHLLLGNDSYTNIGNGDISCSTLSAHRKLSSSASNTLEASMRIEEIDESSSTTGNNCHVVASTHENDDNNSRCKGGGGDNYSSSMEVHMVNNAGSSENSHVYKNNSTFHQADDSLLKSTAPFRLNNNDSTISTKALVPPGRTNKVLPEETLSKNKEGILVVKGQESQTCLVS